METEVCPCKNCAYINNVITGKTAWTREMAEYNCTLISDIQNCHRNAISLLGSLSYLCVALCCERNRTADLGAKLASKAILNGNGKYPRKLLENVLRDRHVAHENNQHILHAVRRRIANETCEHGVLLQNHQTTLKSIIKWYKELFDEKHQQLSGDRKKLETVEREIMRENGMLVERIVESERQEQKRAEESENRKQIENLKIEISQANQLVSLYRSQQISWERKACESEKGNQKLRQRHKEREGHLKVTLERTWNDCNGLMKRRNFDKQGHINDIKSIRRDLVALRRHFQRDELQKDYMKEVTELLKYSWDLEYDLYKHYAHDIDPSPTGKNS